jgi:hypothetical protein
MQGAGPAVPLNANDPPRPAHFISHALAGNRAEVRDAAGHANVSITIN